MHKEYISHSDLKEIKEAFKPGLFTPILISLAFIAPYLWLVVDILEQRYDRLFFLATVGGPAIAYITFSWTSYYYRMQEYKKEVSDYLKNPEEYEW